MATYPPPNFTEPLSIFNRINWISHVEAQQVNPVTPANFLRYPVAQGTETFDDLISLGTANLTNVNVNTQFISTCPLVVADVFPAPTQTAVLSASQLTFSDASTTNTILLDDTQILLASISTPNSIDIKNNVMTLTNVSGSNLLTADSWSGNIASVNTSVNSTHYLGFFDSSATGSGKPQKVASLSCNPSTGLLTATTFSGALSGNASSASTVNTVNDNSNVAYNLVFCAGASPTSNLLIDSVTAPLTYNPNTGDINTASITTVNVNATTLTGEIRYSAGSSPAATFTGTTLTILLNSVSIRTNTIIFTGGANTVTTLSVTSPRNNGIYYVGIRNNGTAGTSFLTGLGGNILTKYSTTVVIPASSSALMSVNIITINAIQTTVVGIDLLT